MSHDENSKGACERGVENSKSCWRTCRRKTNTPEKTYNSFNSYVRPRNVNIQQFSVSRINTRRAIEHTTLGQFRHDNRFRRGPLRRGVQHGLSGVLRGSYQAERGDSRDQSERDPKCHEEQTAPLQSEGPYGHRGEQM